MPENFEYRLNPAYCMFKGVAIEAQTGSKISFLVTDKNVRKCVRKGFYDYVDYVRTLNECPPEYSKRTSVSFKLKAKDEIEKKISRQMGGLYTEVQLKVLEQICNEEKGLVVIATESRSKSYERILHLPFGNLYKNDCTIVKWMDSTKERILRELEGGRLVFVEMEKSNVAEVVHELVKDSFFSREKLLSLLKGIIVQDTHEFLDGEDLLSDIAVLKKNIVKKSFLEMTDEEKENCFIHYTNFGNVLRDGMTRLFDRQSKDDDVNKNCSEVKKGKIEGRKKTKGKISGKTSVLALVFCICVCVLTGCDETFKVKKQNLIIRNDFIRTCLGNGFISLNDWQNNCRERFGLDYIGWSLCEDFMLDSYERKTEFPLYYGCWKLKGGDSYGSRNRLEKYNEVYCRSFVKQDVDKSELVIPYGISGELDYSGLELNLKYWFFNNSDKNIRSLTIVFYLFDEDGNPPESIRNNVVLNQNLFVERFSNVSKRINLQDYFDVIPEQEFSLEYLYVSKIEFADGTVWTDPFGMKYLR